jgi:uracil-DNA glycosylase
VLLALATLAVPAAAMPKPRPTFGHEATYHLDRYTLIGSYHPSQRNTQTGLPTLEMFDQVFQQAKDASAMASVTNRP